MDLEGISLIEISQTRKGMYCMVSLICGVYEKLTEEKIRFVVIRSRGRDGRIG